MKYTEKQSECQQATTTAAENAHRAGMIRFQTEEVCRKERVDAVDAARAAKDVLLDELRQQVSDLKVVRTGHENTIHDLEKQVQAADDRDDQHRTDLDAQSEQAQINLTAANSELRSAQEARETAQRATLAKQAELDNIKSASDKYRDSLATVRSEVELLKGRESDVSAQIAQCQSDRESLEQQRSEFQNHKETTETSLRSARQSLDAEKPRLEEN